MCGNWEKYYKAGIVDVEILHTGPKNIWLRSTEKKFVEDVSAAFVDVTWSKGLRCDIGKEGSHGGSYKTLL